MVYDETYLKCSHYLPMCVLVFCVKITFGLIISLTLCMLNLPHNCSGGWKSFFIVFDDRKMDGGSLNLIKETWEQHRTSKKQQYGRAAA